MSTREELVNEIMMLMIRNEINPESVKTELEIILGKYEVSERTTEISLVKEDINEKLIHKFIVGKVVKGCTENTINLYNTEIRRIILTINKNIYDIDTDDIRLYLAKRQRIDKVSKSTADNELRYLRSFFAYLVKEELITKDPTLKIDKIKSEKRKKKAFTEIEVETIRNKSETVLEKAITDTLLSTGCRVEELVNIKKEDIQDNKITVYGKGEKERIVYLNAKAILSINALLNAREDTNEYLFCGAKDNIICKLKRKEKKNWYMNKENVSDTHINIGTIQSIVRKIGKRCNITNVHPHRFRRTCATFALRRGMPIEQVSKMLGHEDLRTTQIYLDLLEEDLESSHKKYVV